MYVSILMSNELLIVINVKLEWIIDHNVSEVLLFNLVVHKVGEV